MKGSISELSDAQLNELVRDCSVIVSCLGHNINFKGIFGNPRNLVYDAVRRISTIAAGTAQAGQKPRLILMSTTGYTNKAAGERNTIGERMLFALLKLCLPPHRDNMKAADYLIQETASNNSLEWVAVRPDTLFNTDEEQPYDVCPAPVRSPLFNAGKTSRMQVSHFMAELITDSNLWAAWKHSTPVLYARQQAE